MEVEAFPAPAPLQQALPGNLTPRAEILLRCGGNGAGVAHYGLSSNGRIADNRILFNQAFDQTVANSGNRVDVVERFVDACRRRGILPGFYYCSWDNGHRFGSRRVPRRDLINFCFHLEQLTGAGVPLG